MLSARFRSMTHITDYGIIIIIFMEKGGYSQSIANFTVYGPILHFGKLWSDLSYAP